MKHYLFTFEEMTNRLFRIAQILEIPYAGDETGFSPVLSDIVAAGSAEYVIQTLFGETEYGANIAERVLSYEAIPVAMVAALEIAINESFETNSYTSILQAVSAFDLSELHTIFELYQNAPAVLSSLVDVTSVVAQAFLSKKETLNILRYAMQFVKDEETLSYVSDGIAGLVSATRDQDLLKDALNVAQYYSSDSLETFMYALSAAANGPELPHVPRYQAIRFVITTAAIWKENPHLAASTLQGFAQGIYEQRETVSEDGFEQL